MDKQNIETIYPLAPLQQAFLWHRLQTSSQAGLLHLRCSIRGELDPVQLRQAWELVVRCHPALRTSVHWQSVKEPLQVVARRVNLPWTELDWREREDPQTALVNFLAEDGERGFELTQAPIMRLTLIRLKETDYEFVWSCHHLMLDGWSGIRVLNQVFDHYEALRQGQPLAMAPVPTYQAYLRWLKQQDEAAAATFWQKTLQGFTLPTPLPTAPIGDASSATATSRSLSRKATAALQDFLRSQRLTLNTVMQGVWALLLHSYSGETDVLFGATVSGRQGNLPGIEAIVGLLINILPVRVQVLPDQATLMWLQTLQTQQAAASGYAYASLTQIQTWSGLSGRLFDSLLVMENYPSRQTESKRSLQVDNIQSGIVSTYGLTVIVKPGDVLTLMIHTEKAFNSEILHALLEQFQEMLSQIVENPMQSIRELLPSAGRAIAATSIAAPNVNRTTLAGTFSTPRNLLELKLTQIWESVLGVSPLSVEASFFDLGGNSWFAVQLFNQMQQQLNCTLPLATLLQAPSVRKFAALLTQEPPAIQWSSLVPIQPSGSKQPFFFHGGSADALTWARFSHLLGADRPFYALQRPDLDGSDVIHTTVKALANACLQEMRMVQPAGPYLVGGHCFGGAVAFEIAQQLQAQGEAITSLVLIDAYCPKSLPKTSLIQLQTQLQLGLFWLRKNYYYHGGLGKLAQLPRKVWQRLKPPKPPQPRVNSVASQTTAHVLASNSTTDRVSTAKPRLSYEERYARAQTVNERAAEQYSPQTYSGQIKLFRANIQMLDWYFGPALGWQLVANEKINMTTIPGFFGNLFNQRSGPLLAEQVKTYLSKLP